MFCFLNDYTRNYWTYLANNHCDFFNIYHMFRGMIKTQHNIVIKCFVAQERFRVKRILLLFVLLIKSHHLSHQVCFPLKNV